MTLDVTERTSAHGLEAHIRGKRIAASDVLADRDILVQIFNREREEGNFIVPAVAEPLLVWIISGNAAVQERELGGQWETSEVAKGDFFLTTSAQPYEMRWNVSSADDFEVMHIYLGVPLLEKAIHEILAGLSRPFACGKCQAGVTKDCRYCWSRFGWNSWDVARARCICRVWPNASPSTLPAITWIAQRTIAHAATLSLRTSFGACWRPWKPIWQGTSI